MLRKLNLLPLLVLPGLTAYFVFQEGIVVVPWLGERYALEDLPTVQSFQIQSKVTGSTYTIYVQVPHSYGESDKRYPVFYALDGRPAVGLYDEMVLPLLRRRAVPETIFVGINFPAPPPSGNALFGRLGRSRSSPRIRQLTAYADKNFGPETTGDAELFTKFLEEELLPLIDERYRTAVGDRGLGGYELAGLFVVRTAIVRPGLFQRFIAIAPSIYWGDYTLIEEIQRAYPQPDAAPARLYVGVGGDDYPGFVRGWELLRDAMARVDHGPLRFEPDFLPARTHETAILPAARNGLEWVYRDL